MASCPPREHREAGGFRVSLARFIMLATSIVLFVGLGALAAWQITGRIECIDAFFDGPGALFLVTLAFFEFSLARIVVRQFAAGEPLQPAWFLIMLSAGCHLTGAVCVRILSFDSPLNPLVWSHRSWFSANAGALERFGLLVGGPLQILLLVVGLGYLLRVCGPASLIPRFGWFDWTLILLALTETGFEIFNLLSMAGGGQILTTYDFLQASTGPLLLLLAIEANLVKRFMSMFGVGLIARCWTSFVVGISMTTLGYIGLWLAHYGFLPQPLAATVSYIWFLAPTAMALGPAWQIEAIQSACGEVGVAKFSPFASSLAALRLLNTKST